MPRRKVTPFARFLLAMILIVPLAFAGASYINGEDPIANFKSLIGTDATEQPREAPAPAETTVPAERQPSPGTDAAALEAENKRLQRQLEERNRAIKDLQEQLKNCQ